MTLTAITTEDKKIILEQEFKKENLVNVLERIEISQYGTSEEIEIVIK